MSDYNVNMKKFNGTDYDNILPMSYLAKTAEKLGGGATSDIITQARNGLSQIATGSYVGNGVGSAKIYMGFEPQIIWLNLGMTVSAGNWNNYQYINGVPSHFSTIKCRTNNDESSYSSFWNNSTMNFLVKDVKVYSGSSKDSNGNNGYGLETYYFNGFNVENGILTFYSEIYAQSTRSISYPPTPSKVIFNAKGTTYYWLAIG